MMMDQLQSCVCVCVCLFVCMFTISLTLSASSYTFQCLRLTTNVHIILHYCYSLSHLLRCSHHASFPLKTQLSFVWRFVGSARIAPGARNGIEFRKRGGKVLVRIIWSSKRRHLSAAHIMQHSALSEGN